MIVIDRVLQGEFINPSTFLGALFYAVVFFMLTLLAIRSLRMALVPLQRKFLDRTAATFLGHVGQAGLYVMALILVCACHTRLRSLGTALLASVSVASIVLGLAARPSLSRETDPPHSRSHPWRGQAFGGTRAQAPRLSTPWTW